MDTSLVIAVVTTVGGLVGALVAILKYKPEVTKIIVDSATDVIVVQKDALEGLRTQMAELERRMTTQLAEAEEARRVAEEARRVAEEALAHEQRRNQELEHRVETLEAEVAELRGESAVRRTRPPKRP